MHSMPLVLKLGSGGQANQCVRIAGKLQALTHGFTKFCFLTSSLRFNFASRRPDEFVEDIVDFDGALELEEDDG
jgi:hypothetical protein